MIRGSLFVTSRVIRTLIAATGLLAVAGCAASGWSVSPASASPPVVETATLALMPAGTATLSRDPRSGLITIAFDVYGMALSVAG